MTAILRAFAAVLLAAPRLAAAAKPILWDVFTANRAPVVIGDTMCLVVEHGESKGGIVQDEGVAVSTPPRTCGSGRRTRRS